MKYACFLILLFVTIACGPCSHDDCDNRPRLFFNIVDESGEDLIYALDGQVDSLKIVGDKNYPLYSYGDFRSKYIETQAFPMVENYKFTYKNLSANITIISKQTDQRTCCGPLYAVDKISSADGPVPTETRDNQLVYVITMKSN